MQTEIAFILDRSGSMQSMTHAAIAGFNEFLKAQQATVDDRGEPIPATFTLILFDQEYLPVNNRVPIQDAAPLTRATYQARGNTALLDAIGRALAATPEPERPSKVIIAILTDGEENASRKFSMADINQRITHQTEHYQWEFLFLGANQDAIATAARLGIQAHNSATFVADAHDVQASSAAFSQKISAKRRETAACDLSVVESAAANEAMTETLEKSRKSPQS